MVILLIASLLVYALLPSIFKPQPRTLQTTSYVKVTLSLVALGIFSWFWYDSRPRGSLVPGLVEVKDSAVEGFGVFATRHIAQGTVLGRYPGRHRTPAQMMDKCVTAPRAKGYCFQTADGRYLDPTDSKGQVSRWPGPGVFWPLPTDPTLAYINEPCAGQGDVNVKAMDVESGSQLQFVTERDIMRGQELYLDYGRHYDRSDYAKR